MAALGEDQYAQHMVVAAALFTHKKVNHTYVSGTFTSMQFRPIFLCRRYNTRGTLPIGTKSAPSSKDTFQGVRFRAKERQQCSADEAVAGSD